MMTNLSDDEWSNHVMNGEAFTAQHTVVAVPAMFPFAQIYNPVASGVRVRLRCIEPMAFLGSAINMNVRRHDTALTMLASPPFGGPENMLGGGPAPAAEFRFDNLATNVGSPFWLFLSIGNVRKDYPVRHQDWGHDLLEGQGVMLGSGAGLFIISGFQWVEIPL